MTEQEPKPEAELPATRKEKRLRSTPPALLARTLFDAIELSSGLFGISVSVKGLKEWFQGRSGEYWKSLEEKKIEIVKQLLESDIDPEMFDVLLAREVDRHLKVRFGSIFLLLTLLFTSASYAIVICDGIYKWNISQVAITALIIETPIQFIGLLYIIARNLFPQPDGNPRDIKQAPNQM